MNTAALDTLIKDAHKRQEESQAISDALRMAADAIEQVIRVKWDTAGSRWSLPLRPSGMGALREEADRLMSESDRHWHISHRAGLDLANMTELRAQLVEAQTDEEGK